MLRKASARLIVVPSIRAGKRRKATPCFNGSTVERFPLAIWLLAAVFVFIAGDRVAGVSCVVTVVVNLGQVHVPIDESDDALGITVKRRVGFGGLAAMPG